jgi:hypothetical protein
MMILSRLWYVLLGAAVSVALYVLFVAAGQYDRQNVLSLKEGLASDSQTVEWALKIDARRRLDALLAGSVDATLQQSLVSANASKEAKVPDKARSDARKALASVSEAIPADFRPDASFAVDRDGRVVAQVGYDAVAGNDDFELGGYPAVNDALHGWLRDDVWLFGNRMYAVVARPVEYDATQRPAGAIVGLKEVNKRFAADLAKRTRTSLVFYTAAQRVAGGSGVDGFDEEKLDAIGNDLKNVDSKTYGESGHSDPRMLTDDLGAMYARLGGDASVLGGGFAVVRARKPLGGPAGFLSNADDKDKANVPWILLALVVLGAALIGIGCTVLEHALPLHELVMQADRLKSGVMDGLQVARFRGAYRLAAQNLNLGMERAIEKAGGVSRKPADLESILGPAPAQPSMSAFSFPLADGGAAPPPVPPVPPAAPSSPGLAAPSSPGFVPPPRPGGLPPPNAPRPAAGAPPPLAAPAPLSPPLPSPPAFSPAPGPAKMSPPMARPGFQDAKPMVRATRSQPLADDDDEDATMVGAVPAEVMAQATGEGANAPDPAEWLSVYDDFVRVKRQCGEPVDGLTFEKFAQTLKKNRDALIERHRCRRVKFTVYMKEGRASLKATPVKD